MLQTRALEILRCNRAKASAAATSVTFAQRYAADQQPPPLNLPGTRAQESIR